MILFATGLCTSVLIALYRPRSSHLSLAIYLVGTFMLLNSLAFLRGLLSGRDSADVFLEMQPQLYWLLAPFFALTIDSISRVKTVSTVVIWASSVLSVGYILGLAAVAAGILDFEFIYSLLDTTDEFSFREGGFLFYKGFLYLCIGFIFLLALRRRMRWLLLIAVGAAVALTMTRGFIVATAVAALLLVMEAKRMFIGALITVAIAAPLLLPLLFGGSETGGLAAQREISNAVRLADLDFMADRLDLTTLLFGQGYGALINGRLNIENTYLWLIWKTGVLGLVTWLAPLLLCVHYYRLIPKTAEHHALAAAYMYSVFLIYIQTGANPYLNNPIGLGFVMVAIFALRTIRLWQGAAAHRQQASLPPKQVASPSAVP